MTIRTNTTTTTNQRHRYSQQEQPAAAARPKPPARGPSAAGLATSSSCKSSSPKALALARTSATSLSICEQTPLARVSLHPFCNWGRLHKLHKMHFIKKRLNGYSFYWALWLVQPLHGYWLTNEWVHSCLTNQNAAALPLALWLAAPSWNCWWVVNRVVTALIITCRAEMWTIWMKFAWQFTGGEGTVIWLAEARGASVLTRFWKYWKQIMRPFLF